MEWGEKFLQSRRGIALRINGDEDGRNHNAAPVEHIDDVADRLGVEWAGVGAVGMPK